MKLKTIVFAFSLVVTIAFVQGFPRTHRFKPVVNLNPEKVTSTQKPIEERKSTLFPKNTKKYVVTDKPLPRITAPSSYKYILAKRPLMLNFEPTSTLLRNGEPVPQEYLMKKVNFVVSTPLPFERNGNKNYWENDRPIHVRNNKPTEDNVNNKVPENNFIKNIDKITAQPHLNTITTTESTMVPKNESRDIILLPVSEQELKSNPNAVADEVSDIIAFVNKLHGPKENISKIESTTQQPIDKAMLIHPAVLPSTKVSESSSVKPIHEYTTVKNEDNNRRQTPNEDVIDVLYILPKSEVHPISSSTTEKTTTTSSPVQKDTTSESYPLKDKSDKANEPLAPEVVFIPVNLRDVKLHPDLVAEEVRNVVNDMSKHAPQVTESSTSTTVASTSSSTITPTSTTTAKTTPVTMGSEKPEIIILAKSEPISSNNGGNKHNQNTNDDVERIIYHVPKNKMTTPLTPTQKDTITESYPHSTPEIVFIPVDLNDLKTHPDLIAEEVKNTVNEITKHASPVTESTTVAMTSTFTTPLITTTTTTTEINTMATPKGSEKSELNSSPDVIFLPVNLADLKSHPNAIEDEIKDVVNLFDDNPKSEKKNETTLTPSTKTLNKGVVPSTTPREREIITSTSAPLSTHMSNPESTVPAKISEKDMQPEIIFIPVNLNDFESHPSGVIDEVHDILNDMNKPNSSIQKNLTDYGPTTVKKDQTTESSKDGMTTEKLVPTNDIVSTTQTDVHSSKITFNDVTTENPHNFTAENLPEVMFIPVNLHDIESNPVIADEVRDIIDYMNKLHPHDNKGTAPIPEKTTPQESVSPTLMDKKTETTSATTSSPTPKMLAAASTTETDATTESYLKSTTDANPSPSKDRITTEGLPQEIVFIPIKLEELKSNPDLVADEVNDIVDYMNEKDKNNNNPTVKDTSSIKTTSEIPAVTATLKTSPITETTENIVTPKYVIIEPIEDTNAQSLETDATTESNVKSTSDANPSPSKDRVTTEGIPQEIVFIPIKLDELKSNPDLVADELNDIVNYMNEKDKNNNNPTVKDTSSMKTTSEIPVVTTTLKTYPITETTENIVTPKYVIIEPIEDTNAQSLETDATTESNVKSTSDANPSPSKDRVTTEGIPQEIVFIPIKLDELKSNPDLVADELNDIVDYMNEKDKNNNNPTVKDTSSMKTTSEIPVVTTTLKTFPITETPENIVTPKHVIIEPIEVTALKDDDENDIYLGNVIKRPKFTNKHNHKKTGDGKSNSISDDISDVVYVINKNKNN